MKKKTFEPSDKRKPPNSVIRKNPHAIPLLTSFTFLLYFDSDVVRYETGTEDAMIHLLPPFAVGESFSSQRCSFAAKTRRWVFVT